MTITPELKNLNRVTAAAVEHVLEATDNLATVNAHLLATLDRAAGLEPSQKAEPATRNARELLAASASYVALVATLRPIDTAGWR